MCSGKEVGSRQRIGSINGPVVLVLLLLFIPSLLFGQHRPPNIVLIVADDLGYGDLSCYGATEIQTPNIDALASQGVRLTSFYANAPECTPTRAALLTGRYQQRVGGLECAIGLGNIGRYEEAKVLSDSGQLGLPVDFSVLPRVLKDHGYQTAIIGKWHLGDGADHRPEAHGFDYSIGPLGGAVDYFHHTEPIGEFLGTYMKGNTDFYRNGKPHQRTGYYLTHLITDEAEEWLNHQDTTTPFFLYLPYTVPHTPLQSPVDYRQKPLTMEGWRNADQGTYRRMIEDFDQEIGNILGKIEEKGFERNTIIFFLSDNGPTSTGSTGIYSGNKGHVFEGGIRVPCIIRWPGKIKSKLTIDQPYITMDITASIVELLNAKASRGLDGIDILGFIAEGKSTGNRPLFWRKKRGSHTCRALRSGFWKYIRESDGTNDQEYLFNLKEDPGEKTNLLDDMVSRVKEFRNLYADWEMDVQGERYK